MTIYNSDVAIEIATLRDWVSRLADFKPYLDKLVSSYEVARIEEQYVDLSCTRVEVRNGVAVYDKSLVKPVDNLVDKWLREPGAGHLSILGSFGMGKSWFSKRYVYKLAMQCIRNSVHHRVPIYFDLADHNPNNSLAAVIVQHLTSNGVSLGRHALDTFAFLNTQGRLLLILDSFDQMEQSADTPDVSEQLFWEISTILKGNSKILLMGRSHYFKHLAEAVSILRPNPSGIIMPGGRVSHDGQYSLAYLVPLESEDVKFALKKRLPDTYQSVFDKIQSIYDLGGLAGRPLLLNLISETLPKIDDVESVNQLTIYETYFTQQAEGDYQKGKSPTTPKTRSSFMQKLAWDMFQQQKTSIPPLDFSKAVKSFFRLRDETTQQLYERDLRTQAYLVRDDEGDYRFEHESFKEFLVAKRVMQRLRKGENFAKMFGRARKLVGRRLYLRGIYKFLAQMLNLGDEDKLLPLVRSSETWERFLAIYLLGRPRDVSRRPEIIKVLEEQLASESDIMTRRELIYALARLGREDYWYGFLDELRSDPTLLQYVYRIGYFDYHLDRGGPVAEISWRLVNHVDKPARIEYIHFLGSYGDANCISTIKQYLNDPDQHVRFEARDAIIKLEIKRRNTQ